MSESFFWWNDAQKQIAEKASQFVEENVEEAETYFWNKKFPWPLVKKVAAEGYFGAGIPKEYGGLELGATGGCIVAEQLGRLYAVEDDYNIGLIYQANLKVWN